MKIKKLENGVLVVPMAMEHENVIFDMVIEIKPTHTDYEKYLQEYDSIQQQVSKEK